MERCPEHKRCAKAGYACQFRHFIEGKWQACKHFLNGECVHPSRHCKGEKK